MFIGDSRDLFLFFVLMNWETKTEGKCPLVQHLPPSNMTCLCFSYAAADTVCYTSFKASIGIKAAFVQVCDCIISQRKIQMNSAREHQLDCFNSLLEFLLSRVDVNPDLRQPEFTFVAESNVRSFLYCRHVVWAELLELLHHNIWLQTRHSNLRSIMTSLLYRNTGRLYSAAVLCRDILQWF